jgi:hypothetical protein
VKPLRFDHLEIIWKTKLRYVNLIGLAPDWRSANGSAGILGLDKEGLPRKVLTGQSREYL